MERVTATERVGNGARFEVRLDDVFEINPSRAAVSNGNGHG